MAKPFESRLQDLVYNVEVGIGLKIIKVALYALVMLCVMLLYTVSQFKGLDNKEAMDYAQLGRNVMVHKDLSTQYIRPISLWKLSEAHKGAAIGKHPDLIHPPLYPAVLAAGYSVVHPPFDAHKSKVFKPEAWVVIPMNHGFSLMTGVLVFVIGARLFSRKIAWLGGTIYLLSDLVWADSISGTGVSMVAFIATLTFYLLLLAGGKSDFEERVKFRWLFVILAAVFAAAGFLTRYGFIALIPAFILFVLTTYGRGSWRWALLFLLLFIAGITPWIVRNMAVSGSPLGLAPLTCLIDSPAFPENAFERTLLPDISANTIIVSLKLKMASRLKEIYMSELPAMGGGLLMPFFLASFFFRFKSRAVRNLRWGIFVGLFGILVLACAFDDSTTRLLHIIWPFAVLYGLAFFFLLLDRMELQLDLFKVALTSLFVFFCIVPLILSLMPPRKGIPYPPYYRPIITHVSGMLEPDELLCTDMPWATAWYGNRTSLELPMTLDNFYEINDTTQLVKGLYITTVTRNKAYVKDLVDGPYKEWFPIFEGRLPSGFPLNFGLPVSGRDQVFFSDRERWDEQ